VPSVHPASPALPQLSPYVTELSLFDIAGTPGVAADVSHINSPAKVKVRTARPARHVLCVPSGLAFVPPDRSLCTLRPEPAAQRASHGRGSGGAPSAA
jgi:hypothetical protein